MSRRLLTVFFIILPVLALNRAAYGQTDAQDELGIKPYGAYDVTDIDAINLDNLSLTLDIPIYSLPQRGKLAVSYSVRYSNAGFGTQTTCPGPTKSSCIYTTMAAPVLGNTPTQSRFANVFMDQLIFPYFINNPTGQTYVQEGNSLPYYEMDYAIADASGASHTIAYENGVYRAVDGSGWSFIPQFTTPSPTTPVATEWTAGTAYGTAVDAQGIQYRQIQEAGGSGDFQTSIVDPDGNQIAYAGGITEFQVGAVVDTLGRTIPTVPTAPTTTSIEECPTLSASYQSLVGSATWTPPGYDGTSATYTFCFAQILVQTGPVSETSQIQNYKATPTVLQSIVLPNKRYWGFIYQAANPEQTPNPLGYGYLSEVLTPAGGSISYTYFPYYEGCANTSISNGAPPSIQTRTINYGNGTSAEWTYAPAYVSGTNNPYSVTVTDPTGNQTVHTFTDVSGLCGMYETTTQSSTSTSGKLSATQTKTTTYQAVKGYSYFANEVAALPTSTTVTWPNGQSYEATTTYDSGFTATQPDCYLAALNSWYCPLTNTATIPIGKRLTESEYDYSGALLRQVQTNYLWQASTSYLSANLLGTPSSVLTYGPNSAKYAETDYSYDQSGQVALTPSQSVSTGMTSAPNPGVYGHVTTITEWLNTASNSSAYPKTLSYWLDTGMLDHVVDPNQRTTKYQYASAFEDAYVEGVTNALNQTTEYNYDFNTGLMNLVKDSNGQSTYADFDEMRRPTKVAYPDGGGSIFTYNDPSSPNDTLPTVTQVKKINTAGTTETAITNLDGVGRQVGSEIELSANPIYTATTYDGLNRVVTATNPFVSTSDTTYGYVQNTYDALNRPLSVTNQDKTSQSWTYTGATTDYFDENSNHSQQVSDGLGRLLSATEPNATSNTPSYVTNYEYDPLSNLLEVDQYGGAIGSSGDRKRTFTYDSLSRLLCSSNPESSSSSSPLCPSNALSTIPSGLLAYAYDPVGNVLTKTDARGITTTFAYDALNRVSTKRYSDNTPSAFYSYDTTPTDIGSYPSYPIGRLSQSWTSLNPLNPGGLRDPEIVSYDARLYDTMGRNTLFNAYLFGNYGLADGTSYNGGNLITSYDLAGNVAQTTTIENNSSNLLVVDYSYDAANRLNAVKFDPSSVGLNPNLPTALFQAPNYSAVGLTSAQLAVNPANSSPAIALTQAFDTRLRQTRSAYATSSGAPTGSGSPLYSYSITLPSGATGYAKNGNVVGFMDSVDGAASVSYDTLNRLTTGAVTAGLYEGLQVAWSYDQWGNRLAESFSGSPSQPLPTSSSASYSVKNQVNGNSYDSAGNVTADALNQYAYDAEGRLCAVENKLTTSYTSYAYDADGLRLAKASLAPPNGTAFNTALCSPLINGYTLYEYYTISQSGQQMQRFNNSGWENDNIYAGGKLLVSLAGDQQYFGDNQYYQLSDWLGTRHGQVTSDGNPAHLLEFFSLPFGETAAPVGSGIDISNLHFTGKQTDLESGNDDFRARSYDPLMGRFLSPDWSKSPEAVPYADLSNPQSLNLYAYVNNNPLSRTDKDGHFWEELKNWFGAAGCWCNAVQAATAIQNMRNDLQTWQAKFNGQAPDYQHISPGQVRSYHDQFTTAANAFSQQQQSQAGELSILRFLHGKELLEQNSNISSIRQMSTQQIIDSLKPGQSGSLKVKPDGTVMDGNTRLRVLEERGVDINNLPRDIHTSEPIAPWESPEGEGPIEPIP